MTKTQAGSSFTAPLYYNSSGLIQIPSKKWVGLVTPNTGSGYSIDISSAGFSSILMVSILPLKNAVDATSIVTCNLKSVSTTTLVVNLIEGNAQTVSILGNFVLSGVANIFATVTGLTLYVEVTGS